MAPVPHPFSSLLKSGKFGCMLYNMCSQMNRNLIGHDSVKPGLRGSSPEKQQVVYFVSERTGNIQQ